MQSRKQHETPNSKHIQASADLGNRRYNECFPPGSRLELKPAPHPGTFYSHSWNYLVHLLYPQPSVMGWAGRDKLSNQKIEGSISGCDNLIRQLIYINICTARWCRWAFAYFFFLDAFWQARGEYRASGVPGESWLKPLFPHLSSALSQWYQKGEGEQSTHLFLPFPANSAAVLCLSFLVSQEGQRGSMSKSQFWLSGMTAHINRLFFGSLGSSASLLSLHDFAIAMGFCSVNLVGAVEGTGLFPRCWALSSLWSYVLHL